MPKPIEDHTDQQLRNVVDNHRAKGRLTEPYYLSALDELARRKGHGLDFTRSLELIRRAARDKRFISYKELAEESGADWSKVRYAMNTHLGYLIDFAHGRGWPLLSAIVVNKQNLQNGDMEPTTLTGFVEAARFLGYTVNDKIEFLRVQQQRVFAWAAGETHQ